MSSIMSEIHIQRNKLAPDILPNMDEQAIIDQNYKYYFEFQKLNEANIILSNQLKELSKERNVLKQKINKLEMNKKNEVQIKVIEDSYNIRRVRIQYYGKSKTFLF
jgi:hypothetical protein